MEVRPVRSGAELEAALALRVAVFTGEQGVAQEADRDGRDDDAVHVVAVDHGEVVGTLRLLIEDRLARLGRIVVAAPMRRRGVAARMLAAADAIAHDHGAEMVRLSAQLTARTVYERADYRAYGDVYVEEGIDHVAMEKRVV